MEPVACKVTTAGAAALGDFVLVVREDEVHATGVQVEGIAEVFVAHGRAFQVPAGATLAPRRGPEVGAVLRAAGFPEHEVGHAVFFVLIRIGAGLGGLAEVEFLAVEVSQFAVIGVGRNAEIDRAVLALVSVALVHEVLDDIELLFDVAHGAGLHVRGEAVERLAVIVEFSGPLGCIFAQRHALGLGIADGLVIHIREVTHMLGAQATQFHHAAEDILHHEGAEITDVSCGVHGGAATVEAQLLAVFCLHGLHCPRLCIV